MLYAYAIEPDVLVTWDKCRNTLNLMGFRHGRAIAAYPSSKRWKRMIFQACNKSPLCGERESKRILEKIRESEDKLVRSDAVYDDELQPADERWIRNAVDRQGTESAFHAILSTRNPTNHPDVVLEENVDESHEMIGVPREAPVLREPAALAAHIETLVRNSRELLLIDPHLDLSKGRWRPVIEACLKLTANTVRDDPIAEIHTLDAKTKWSFDEFRRAVSGAHSEDDVRETRVGARLSLASSRRQAARFPRAIRADRSKRLQAGQGIRRGTRSGTGGRTSRRSGMEPRPRGLQRRQAVLRQGWRLHAGPSGDDCGCLTMRVTPPWPPSPTRSPRRSSPAPTRGSPRCAPRAAATARRRRANRRA